MSDRPDNAITKRARKIVARIKKSAADKNHELSDWEDEFLTSLDERLDKYGRAFQDPDLGAMCGALSLRQGLKIKEIGKKINPKPKKEKELKPFKPIKTKKPLLRKSAIKNRVKKT